MTKISSAAAMSAVVPTFFNFRRLNSRPSENIRKITPSSPSVWMVFSSSMRGKRKECGPMMTPAMM